MVEFTHGEEESRTNSFSYHYAHLYHFSRIIYYSIFFLFRGENSTATGDTFHSLSKFAKDEIQSHLGMFDKNQISMDMDAFSIVISTTDKISDEMKTAIRAFLLPDGGGVTGSGVNFPTRAIGLNKSKDGMFGCCGTQCQHLPQVLRGNEVLVIDTPVKIGLHKSCRDKLVDRLNRSGAYVTAASKASGVCFDPQAAVTKPTYSVLVDAIIDSCNMASENHPFHIVHVAQLGCRVPLPDDEAMDRFFCSLNEMRTSGFHVELVQFDLAFVSRVPRNHLIQVNCSRSRQHDEPTLLQDTTTTVYPLHELPKFENSRLDQRKFEGTINIKKSNWGQRKHQLEIEEGDNRAAKLYLSKSEQQMLSINPDTLHSVKCYSTVAHTLMQRRHKYPLHYREMQEIGKRSIESIQTLAKNLRNSLDESYNIVRKYGIGIRIEFSIRPAEGDDLRLKGHFNDILLVACMSLCEFFEIWKPTAKLLPTRDIETRAMKMVQEIISMVKFRQQLPFNKAYKNKKATEWLQFHLSTLLITIGLIPVVGTRFIDPWLMDPDRLDPFNVLEEEQNSIDGRLSAVKLRMAESLRKHLVELEFSPRGARCLHDFVCKLDKEDPMKCFKELSLKDKHTLAQRLWSDIIPHMSSFLSQGRNRPDLQDRHSDGFEEDSEEMEEESNDTDVRWWKKLDKFPQPILDSLIAESPKPQHPLALAIFSLVKMSTLWSPDRPGFNQILCQFALESITNPRHNNHEDNPKRLLDKLRGSGRVSLRDLEQLCISLHLIPSARKKRGIADYQKLLCERFGFPSSSPPSVALRLEDEEDARKNKILNEVLFADFAIPILVGASKNTFYRTADNTNIEITHFDKFFLRIDEQVDFLIRASSSEIYEVIAMSLNEQLDVQSLQQTQQKWLAKYDSLEIIFLSSSGTTNKDFKGCRSLEDLQSKHVSGYPPELIFAETGYVQKKNIAFYNIQTNTTNFFRCVDSRSIKYQIEGINFIPLSEETLIFSLNEEGIYEWRILNNPQAIPNHQAEMYSVKPIAKGLKRRKLRNLKELPHRSMNRKQSFNKAISILLKNLDEHYLVQQSDADGNPDYLGLLPFLEELSCLHPGHFNGFDQSATTQCHLLGNPLKILVEYLRNEAEWDNLSHKLLCPITCLKHHNLILGVLENIAKSKRTFFYAFIPDTQRVECVEFTDGHYMLTERTRTLYFYCTQKTAQQFDPRTTFQISKENKWLHIHSLVGSFSHIGQSCFDTKYLPTFKSYFRIHGLHQEDSLNEHHFRPEAGSTIVATSVTNNSGQIRHLQLKGIRHSALVMIFPRTGQEAEWDACIVYHPLQCETYALHALRDVIARAPPQGKYNQHTIKGRLIERCESRLLMLLYAILGSNCTNLVQFQTAMSKVISEPDLCKKVRDWTSKVMERKKDITPAWLIQLYSSSTLTLTTQGHIQSRPIRSDRRLADRHKRTLHHESARITMQRFQESKRQQLNLDHEQVTETPIRNNSRTKRRRLAATARHAYLNHCQDEAGNESQVHWRTQPASGLQNPTHTNMCYLNTVVQLLYGMRCTRELFLSGSYWSGQDLSSVQKFADFGWKGGFIAVALQQTFEKMHFRNGRSIVTALKEALMMNTSFTDFDNECQHDAMELLSILLGVLSEALRKDDKDPITDWFRSRVISCVRCIKCGQESYNDRDASISLEIPVRGTTILECMEEFFKTDILYDWTCDKHCKLPCKKELSLERRNILILTIKRFQIHGTKDNTRITFPLDGLDTRQFMYKSDKRQSKYRLVAVINHKGGSPTMGHYTLFMRFGEVAWYTYDDEIVKTMTALAVSLP